MRLPTTEIFTIEQARAAGCSATDVRRLVRSGQWIVLRRGIYVNADHPWVRAGSPAQRHALQAQAALLALQRPTVAAGASAGRILNLSFLRQPRDEVVVMAPDAVHGRRRDGYLMRRAPLPAPDVRVCLDVPITSPARTLLDLSAELPFADGVTLADSALHQKLVAPGELEDVLSRHEGRPGITRAREVFRFADGRAESALESASRVAMRDGVLAGRLRAMPRPQVVLVINGVEVRVDFLWDDPPLVGEADGLTKYEATERMTTLQIVRAEKQREQLIRSAGLPVVRWGWPEVHQPDRLLRLLSGALAGRVA